jgi:TPR repeat protein
MKITINIFLSVFFCMAAAARAEDIKMLPPDAGIDMKQAKAEYDARNYGKARDLYLKDAVDGNSEAQAMLCAIYMSDNGVFPSRPATVLPAQETAKKMVEMKYAEALKWCRKSVAQGNPVGETALGRMYHYGSGVARDDHAAVKLFRKAAGKNHAAAQHALGVMARHGYGVKRDYAEALKWFREAAAQGYASSMNSIGTLYEQGEGVKQDYAEALKWYRQAAEKGDATGEHNLGRMYRYGHGMAVNDEEAVKWYGKAAAQGDAASKKYLNWKEAKGRKDMLDEIDGLHKAVDFGAP